MNALLSISSVLCHFLSNLQRKQSFASRLKMHKYFIFVLVLKLTFGADDIPCKETDQTPKTLPKHNLKHVTYTAAVLEYEAYNEWNEKEKGFGITKKNAETFVFYASEAKKLGADIFVTPEYGLQGIGLYHYELEDFLTFAQFVPDPSEEIVPCHFSGNSDHFKPIQILSCGAERNDIYFASNVLELLPCSVDTISKAPWKLSPLEDCPKEGYFLYNTEVVFDRKGKVITRYRKQNLFTLEVGLSGGAMDDSTAIFVTDFDVAFSLQICFDVVFQRPGLSNIKNYGIRDIIMSTAWIDQLPFALADAVHYGWSRGVGANFIVSGLHSPEEACLGSGIYRSYSNDSVIYTFNKDSGNVLLVGSVRTIAASELDLTSKREYDESNRYKRYLDPYKKTEPLPETSNISMDNRYHSRFYQDLSEFTKVTLKPGAAGEVMTVSACSNDSFCCDLTYQYTGKEIYMLMVYSGRLLVIGGKQGIGVQQCGVVWCKTSDYETCAHVELGLPESDFFGPFEISSSSFRSDVVFPIGNQRNFDLITNSNLEFEVAESSYSLKAPAPIKDHLVTAFFGRKFSDDIVYDRKDD